MKHYTLTPGDVLFFRDGRPTATAGGHGARWPEPSLIFDAVHAALHRAFPEQKPWEHSHRHGRSSDRDPARERSQRFGALQTSGLFPVFPGDRWLCPAPGDVVPSQKSRLMVLNPLRDARGVSNLPAPLKYPLANPVEPSKDESASWWSPSAFNSYLKGEKPLAADTHPNSELFDAEWQTGIGIDPETGTQDGNRIYSAEYLRLRDGVRLGFTASLPTKQNGDRNEVKECIGELFVNGRSKVSLIVGGQQRMCSVSPAGPQAGFLARGLSNGFASEGDKFMVKWVLLSPAIFPRVGEHCGGWLPTWVRQNDGRVMLHHGGPGPNKARRLRVAAGHEIAAKLVAARVAKAITVTGWSERLHLIKAGELRIDGESHKAGARRTLLAVPAGAVYYFEADSSDDAVHLAAALNWHGAADDSEIKNRRSTLLGEKGFGLGVCGTWNFYGA